MDETPELRAEFAEPAGYTFVARAGVGRRSVWLKSRQIRLDRYTALKFLRPELAKCEPFRQAFFEAGRQAAAMVHPAALPIINVYPSGNCIAVHWCDGKPLGQLAGSLPPAHVAAVGEVVMDCLSALHATGRCHGNITPGNIFFTSGGKVWLDDFFQPPIMTDGESLFKTDLAFSAPEIVKTGRLDWRADVFSLGCVLDFILARTDRPRELAAIIEAMRALDPLRRGDSPGMIVNALRKVRRLEETRFGGDTLRRPKRQYRRVPAEFAVSLQRRSATPDETVVILNKIRDIGESGVFVETDDELIGVGSILELNFTLKGVDGNVHAFGIVRWKSSPPMPRGVGVQFVEVDQLGLRRLRQFLEGKYWAF